jgi:hypothetical protein
VSESWARFLFALERSQASPRVGWSGPGGLAWVLRDMVSDMWSSKRAVEA